jgi:dynein light chain roadblock-type
MVSKLSERANAIVRDLDPSNELTYLRLRSRKHEVMIAPEQVSIL